MVLVDIEPKEIEAFDIMLKNTNFTGKNWSMVGYLVGNMRIKIQQAMLREQETQLRGKYGETKKTGNKNTKA